MNYHRIKYNRRDCTKKEVILQIYKFLRDFYSTNINRFLQCRGMRERLQKCKINTQLIALDEYL